MTSKEQFNCAIHGQEMSDACVCRGTAYWMKRAKIAELKASGTLANNLCPDHRDKQTGKPCLACEIERLRALVSQALAAWEGTGPPIVLDELRAVLTGKSDSETGPAQPEILRGALQTIANGPPGNLPNDEVASWAGWMPEEKRRESWYRQLEEVIYEIRHGQEKKEHEGLESNLHICTYVLSAAGEYCIHCNQFRPA